MFSKLKNLFRANLTNLVVQKNLVFNDLKNNKKYYFGNKNKDKSFYIIKRRFNATGMFSNVTFVVDHINHALKKNKIPIIDMENFPTVYNEKYKIKNTLNSWNYYFLSLNKFSLEEVYQSSNVTFSTDKRIKKTFINNDDELIKIFNKYIKINKEIIGKFSKIKKKYFKKNDKIMCVHVRGTIQRIVRGHSLPPHPDDFLKESIKIFKKTTCKKMIIITEDLIYLNIFKNYFKKKLIYLKVPRSKPFFWGDHNLHFLKYTRINHRYLFGQETIIDALILSYADVKLYTDSNVWRISNIISKKKQEKFQFVTAKNSNNKFIARWKWYIKYYFGKIEYKITKDNT